MVIGNYYMMIEDKVCEGEGMIFKDINEVWMVYCNGYVVL